MSQENFTADPQDVQANKVMAILAYFGLLVFVPLFAAKESRFARFHTNQGAYSSYCRIRDLVTIHGIDIRVSFFRHYRSLELCNPYFCHYRDYQCC